MTTAAGATPLLEPQDSPLLILIDGHALVHRAHHAMRDPLTVQSTGEVVSGVYGFLNMFLRAIEEWKPTHCIVTFRCVGTDFSGMRRSRSIRRTDHLRHRNCETSSGA